MAVKYTLKLISFIQVMGILLPSFCGSEHLQQNYNCPISFFKRTLWEWTFAALGEIRRLFLIFVVDGVRLIPRTYACTDL